MAQIEFACSQCRGKLVVDEGAVGTTVSCPLCRANVTVPVQNVTSNSSAASIWRGLCFASAVLSIICIIWASQATFVASNARKELHTTRSRIDELDREAQAQEDEAAKRLQAAKEEASKQLQSAKEEATRIVAQAEEVRQQAQDIVARDREKLNTIFGNLQKYQPGRNNVAKEYLSYIDVSGGRIRTYMVNSTYGTVQPNFRILFVNKYGFITEDFHKYWILDRIKANETRVDDEAISFRYGDPVYFTVEFRQ